MAEDWDLIPQRIKEIRTDHNCNQEKLGKALNLPKQTIYAIEKGTRKVTAEELLKIADYFNEPIEAFYTWDFKYEYYPKNLYGSFPKFVVDFLTDFDFYIDKLKREGIKEPPERLMLSIMDALQKIIKEKDETRY